MQPEYGKIHIVETYYGGKLSSTSSEMETQKKTSRNGYLADIMAVTSELVDGQCKELHLTIHADQQGPKLIEVRKKLYQSKGER